MNHIYIYICWSYQKESNEKLVHYIYSKKHNKEYKFSCHKDSNEIALGPAIDLTENNEFLFVADPIVVSQVFSNRNLNSINPKGNPVLIKISFEL